MNESRILVEHFFRYESARLVASLTRAFGTRHLALVEDVVQTALTRALSSWALKGVPADPARWLSRVARNLAIDALRRDLRWSSLSGNQAATASIPDMLVIESHTVVQDDLLRMIFVCCDDGLPVESQVALALKTLCGFDVHEIAGALLTTEANAAKRITRAKERLREIGLDPAALTSEMLRDRLPNVQAVIYLLFTEGHSSTLADHLVRFELCEEAVRLAHLLAEHPMTKGPQTAAFLALLLFHSSRLETRLDADGLLLLLEAQDRTRWDHVLIAEGFRWFAQSATGDRATRYHAEAWIAAEHCRAHSFAETNWDRIVRAYDMLVQLAPSPIHELNRAIAIAERDGAEAGWNAFRLIKVDASAKHSHYWAATAGELARRRGALDEAGSYLQQAFAHAPTNAEREFLRTRLAELMNGDSKPSRV